MNKKTFSLNMFTLTLVFLYLPLVVLIVQSFNSGMGVAWDGFSLKWYDELFNHSARLWKSFRYSILIALTSAVISTTIGTLGAISLQWYSFKHKKYLQIISYLPLVLPDIIMGVSLLILFTSIKFKLGLVSIFLAHTTFNIPFVLFIVLSRLHNFDYSIVEAAYDLGATEKEALTKVILPNLMPGIVSGLLMSITLSLDDFVITFFVAGPGSSTLPLHIYSMIKFGVSPIINALSVILIAGTIALAMSTKKIQKYMIS
ncbi:ABC transporter permease [Psychrilyobacter sp.]|uniref:ABC transporter permease n=1 Tax=Psychrilyobacter sp. TaxID=2586924 RepID=UPI0030180F1B